MINFITRIRPQKPGKLVFMYMHHHMPWVSMNLVILEYCHINKYFVLNAGTSVIECFALRDIAQAQR